MPKKDARQQNAPPQGPAATLMGLIVTGNPAEPELFLEGGRALGFELTTCGDYWQVGWELTRRPYDLALVDIDLVPVLGLEWLSRLHVIAPDLTIIALTGDNSREREIAARNRGIAFYFVRPADPRELAAIIAHVAHKKSQARGKTSPPGGGISVAEESSPASACCRRAWTAGRDRRKTADRRRRLPT